MPEYKSFTADTATSLVEQINKFTKERDWNGSKLVYPEIQSISAYAVPHGLSIIHYAIVGWRWGK